MFDYYHPSKQASQSLLPETPESSETFEPKQIEAPSPTWTVIAKAALEYRYAFDVGGKITSFALEKHVPNGITKVLNETYYAGILNLHLDVFYQESVTKPQPTLIWVHGGGWVSGDKSQIANYLQIIASKGFTVVGVNYTIAPVFRYPTALKQVNDAIAYLTKPENAERLHIDINKLALAGDSAGSQIAAQMATLYTSPDYKNQIPKLNIEKLALSAQQLKCIVLCCGGYNLKTLVAGDEYKGNLNFRHFFDTVTVAYSGYLNPGKQAEFDTFSVTNYVDANFPRSFITVGDKDPL